jgi:hypothetical protein
MPCGGVSGGVPVEGVVTVRVAAARTGVWHVLAGVVRLTAADNPQSSLGVVPLSAGWQRKRGPQRGRTCQYT